MSICHLQEKVSCRFLRTHSQPGKIYLQQHLHKKDDANKKRRPFTRVIQFSILVMWTENVVPSFIITSKVFHLSLL